MTENEVLKNLMKNQVPLPDVDGYFWINILVKHNMRTSKTEVVRSFTKPAEMSKIKHLVKKKKPKDKPVKIEAVDNAESLF